MENVGIQHHSLRQPSRQVFRPAVAHRRPTTGWPHASALLPHAAENHFVTAPPLGAAGVGGPAPLSKRSGTSRSRKPAATPTTSATCQLMPPPLSGTPPAVIVDTIPELSRRKSTPADIIPMPMRTDASTAFDRRSPSIATVRERIPIEIDSTA